MHIDVQFILDGDCDEQQLEGDILIFFKIWKKDSIDVIIYT